MHPRPRQNNTFSDLSGGYGALFTAPHLFSFNGQERTDEIAGGGNHNTALFWEYDTRLGRRWNVDPLAQDKPWMSSYHAFSNKPIVNIDPSGASDTWYVNKEGEVLMQTDDGSNDVVLIPDEKVEDFEYYGGAINMDPSYYNSQEWNKNQKLNYQMNDKQLNSEQIKLLDEMDSDWARRKAVEYFLNPTTSNYAVFAFSEAISQWTNPRKVLTGLNMLEISIPTAKGAVGRNSQPNFVYPIGKSNFKTPTNPPQLPPINVPEGLTVRIMKPTTKYPNGYWRLEKPMPQGGAQGINPSTMKPGSQHETHIPLPDGYWK